MRYGFFDSEITGEDAEGNPIYDRAENAEFLSRLFASLVTDGVFADSAQNFFVQAAGGMNVTIKAGRAFLLGRFIWAEEDTTLTLAAASSTLPRIDAAVLRLDMTGRTITPVIKTGAPSSSPSVPGLTRTADIYEMQLAAIRVNAGASSIKQADITDTRMDEALCGMVTGVIDQIDTADLFAQYNDQFNTWFRNLENTLDENQAANLQNNINQLDERALSLKADLGTRDLDDVAFTGIYPQNSSANATPERHYPVKVAGCVVSIGYTSKTYQFYLVQNDNRIFYRRFVTNAWKDWEQIHSTPQSGSNGKGSWVKFPDGTLIQSIRTTAQVLDTGGCVVEFPVPFTNSQYSISVNVLKPREIAAFADGLYGTHTNVWFRDLSGGAIAGAWLDFTVTAIGRWK